MAQGSRYEDVVHEVVDTLRPLAGEKGIGLRCRLPGSLPEGGSVSVEVEGQNPKQSAD
jgi:hypothetical protein